MSNPFPGLRPFREEEEHLFFGREKQVDQMIDKLAATRFLAVVGTSGSGKSSLVNCGLRPALHRGLMAEAGSVWRMAQFRPGGQPIRAMAQALAQSAAVPGAAPTGPFSMADLAETSLRLSKLGLLDVYEQSGFAPGTNLLVVADQFEELFRYRQLADAPGEEATALVNLLLEAAAQTAVPIYVAITMRSDFLGDCAQFFGLAEAINRGQYLVPRLTREERRLAIAGPVGVAGASLTPVLATRLVNDVGDNPDQLSILQHALNRTWSQWENAQAPQAPVDLPHYEGIGTMAHALDQHAEEAFAGLKTQREREIAEKLFKAITDRSTDPRGIRRPTRLETLCAICEASFDELRAVIDVFRAPGRAFLMPPAGDELRAHTVIDISHESLMRVWERLARWADEEGQSAKMYRRLADSAALHAAGQASLWRDPELQRALDWQRKNQPNRTWAEAYHPGFDTAAAFLAASEQARRADAEQQQAEVRRAARRRSQWIWSATIFTVLAMGFFTYNLKQRTQADQARELAAVEAKARVDAEKARDEARANLQLAIKAGAEAKAAQLQAEARTKELLAAWGWDRKQLAEGLPSADTVDRSLAANRVVWQANEKGGYDRRTNVKVEYFPKNVDRAKVEAALKELGFTLLVRDPLVNAVATNAIWYGTPVNIDDVKLVALTLMRAGVEFKAIRPIPSYIAAKKDAALIQVGSDLGIVNQPTLGVDEIRNAAAFNR
jgi:energy-coupling factor transporter ATP-binding protein EcfA2